MNLYYPYGIREHQDPHSFSKDIELEQYHSHCLARNSSCGYVPSFIWTGSYANATSSDSLAARWNLVIWALFNLFFGRFDSLNAVIYFTVQITLEVCPSEINSIQVNQQATWNTFTSTAHIAVLKPARIHTCGLKLFLLWLTFKISEISPRLPSALCKLFTAERNMQCSLLKWFWSEFVRNLIWLFHSHRFCPIVMNWICWLERLLDTVTFFPVQFHLFPFHPMFWASLCSSAICLKKVLRTFHKRTIQCNSSDNFVVLILGPNKKRSPKL